MPAVRPVWVAGALGIVVVVGLLVALFVVARGSLLPTGRVDVAPVAGVAVAPTPAAPAPAAPAANPAVAGPVSQVPAATWVNTTAMRTGIPPQALQAYAAAQLVLATEQPGCHVGWTTVAAIGAVESGHGTHGGSQIGADGIDRPTVLGPPLDGTDGNKALADTDGGRLDGDTRWDRAVGPMQFIPQTWEHWGRSATGGVPDPSDIGDAALTAATYLCAAGGDLATDAGWRAAVAAYNEPVEYAVAVADAANRYAARSRA